MTYKKIISNDSSTSGNNNPFFGTQRSLQSGLDGSSILLFPPYKSSLTDSSASSRSSIISSISQNVGKLGTLADVSFGISVAWKLHLIFFSKTCEKVNASLSTIVSESHKVLDNSFLASQPHLTNHICELNYQACLDIVTAINTYEDFIMVIRELVEADEVSYRELLMSWNALGLMSDEMFQKLDKEAVKRLSGVDGPANLDNEQLIFAYDDLIMCEFLDEMNKEV